MKRLFPLLVLPLLLLACDSRTELVDRNPDPSELNFSEKSACVSDFVTTQVLPPSNEIKVDARISHEGFVRNATVDLSDWRLISEQGDTVQVAPASETVTFAGAQQTPQIVRMTFEADISFQQPVEVIGPAFSSKCSAASY
jgi:hypothetical protein